MFILKKKVDWSFLTSGFTIPVEFHPLIHSCYPNYIKPGEKKDIKIIIGNECFDAKLTNENFNRENHPGHTDLIRVLYQGKSKSPLVSYLQQIFNESYNRFLLQREQKLDLKINDAPEYVTLSSTDVSGMFIMDCFPAAENKLLKEDLDLMTESEYESSEFDLKVDKNAKIVELNRVQRVRKLNRSIADSLKIMYDYRCQITGEKIGDKYNCNVVEAHHIEYFTKTMNNDMSNIIIVSPSFHRIIHQTSPHFNRNRLEFEFPNGLVEKVKLDNHLKRTIQ